jgi:hypothetical protein
MSSPGSGVLTVELPARLAAERATVVLATLFALVAEAVAANHPDAPAGLGVAGGLALAGWHLWRTRNVARIRRATLDARGCWQVELPTSREEAELLPGSRVLGSTVVLRLKSARRAHSLWLTGWDLPAGDLRRLRVRLLAQGARASA